MPENLLLDLEPPAPVAGSLENVEDLVRVVIREVGCAVEGMKGAARAFETIWQRIILDVAKGKAAEIQAVRPEVLSAFAKRLGLLKSVHALATWLHKSGRAEVPNPDVLVSEIDRMERLRVNVMERWNTADDLEDLAARDYPLTTADLDRNGPHCRPPSSFYAEESKPF